MTHSLFVMSFTIERLCMRASTINAIYYSFFIINFPGRHDYVTQF